MSSYSNDGSGNQTKQHNVPNDEKPPSSETEQLLRKEKESTAEDGQEDGENTGFLGTIREGYEYFAEHANDAATDFRDAFVDGYENFTENATEMYTDFGDHFVDELTEKDDGESIIYEMGMARNLSMLPSDMEGFAEEMSHPGENASCTIFPPPKPGHRRVVSETKKFIDEEGQKQEVTMEKTITVGAIPLHAYITLTVAVFCLSSIGPSLEMQKEVIPSMKIYWRMTATYIVLAPFAFASIYKEGFPKLTSSQFCTMGSATFCYAFFCVTFVVALEITSVGNVVIFSNSQSLLLLVGKILVGQAVTCMEGSGAIIAFFGGVLCALDSSTTKTGNVFSTATSGRHVWAGFGDILAIFSALGGVTYFVFAKSLREHIPNVFVFMFLNMIFGSMWVLLYLWISGQEFTANRDINIGLWGWMNIGRMDRLPLEIYMVIVCNLLGTMGYLRSMQYFDNLVITVATLLEPVGMFYRCIWLACYSICFFRNFCSLCSCALCSCTLFIF